MTARYFDDFEVGERFISESAALTESDIIDFARQFDPQPFHLDRETAEKSPYGGLIASGFHTLWRKVFTIPTGGKSTACWLLENGSENTYVFSYVLVSISPFPLLPFRFHIGPLHHAL